MLFWFTLFDGWGGVVCVRRIWWMISARSSSWRWATWTEVRSTGLGAEGPWRSGVAVFLLLECIGEWTLNHCTLWFLFKGIRGQLLTGPLRKHTLCYLLCSWKKDSFPHCARWWTQFLILGGYSRSFYLSKCETLIPKIVKLTSAKTQNCHFVFYGCHQISTVYNF